ncbi:N-glycosyltransferase [mine drainage metagenome]|uniref:N-glycosyltransferase n=1 Tax=mine drainage metagenome TaxID=410659 RepID=A0A1J5SNV7_9ZZZZ
MKKIEFVIITYNRPADTLELLQNIVQLDDAGSLLNSVIVVNNASTEDYSLIKKFVAETTSVNFKYIDSEKNLGVAGGRNLALRYATAEILIFLDDDCVLQNKDALHQLLRSFAEQSFDNRETAIVSFKVLYYSTLQMQINGLPHKKIEKYKHKEKFFTYYFAGGAHAIKRKVLTEVGNLPEEFFYGMEEYDLSYRIIDKGYCIKYDANIVMLHKESPLGRKTKEEKLRMMWVNKAKVAWRYLPAFYFYTTALMWSLQYLKETKFNMGGLFKGWRDVLSIPNKEKRNPISKKSLEYLQTVEARLWY